MRHTLMLLLLAVLCRTQANAFSLEYGEKGVVFAWQTDDFVGMLTASSVQMRFGVSSIAEDEHSATLVSPGWSLKDDVSYYAYAPFNPKYTSYESQATALPVDFSLQIQEGNGNMNHLTQHAFYVGNVYVSAAKPDATIHLRPMTAVVRLSRSFETPVTIKRIQLSVDDYLIPLLGTMNLLEESFTPLGFSKIITLEVNNMVVEAGEEVVSYLTLPTCNLEGHTLLITYTDSKGARHEQSVDGFDIRCGSTYCIGEEGFPTLPQSYTPHAQGTKEAPVAVACDLPIAGRYVPTSIESVKANAEEDVSYDLAGRRTHGIRHDITIYKGKKILKR